MRVNKLLSFTSAEHENAKRGEGLAQHIVTIVNIITGHTSGNHNNRLLHLKHLRTRAGYHYI